MKKRIYYGALLAAGLFLAGPAMALDIFILRHAETMANVTKVYSEDNQRTFSPAGQEAIRQLPARLAGYHFDRIFVSPDYRVLRTILPYLQHEKRTAEIWPELAECCWDTLKSGGDTPANAGAPIVLDEELRPFFTFRDGVSARAAFAATAEEGEALAHQTAARILAQYAGSTNSLLVVSHYHTGRHLLKAFLPTPAPRGIRLRNTGLSRLQEQPDGTFRLLWLNDRPFRP